MKLISVAILAFLYSTVIYAGDAENIQACVEKSREFSGVNLNEFEAEYQGNILSMSTARWSNTYCEVKFGEVYNLNVNEEEHIYQGYAGRESYALKQTVDEKTEAAIRQLKSRIALLDQRKDKVTQSLREKDPDHALLIKYIDEGIEMAIGSK